MAVSPQFVGYPRVESATLTLADNSVTFTGGDNGGIIRRIWANAVADSGDLRVNISLDGIMVGYVILSSTGETAYSDDAWTTQATELLLSGAFPGLSLGADRYFELGGGEILTISAGQSDGTSLEAGESVHIRIQGADY